MKGTGHLIPSWMLGQGKIIRENRFKLLLLLDNADAHLHVLSFTRAALGTHQAQQDFHEHLRRRAECSEWRT